MSTSSEINQYYNDVVKAYETAENDVNAIEQDTKNLTKQQKELKKLEKEEKQNPSAGLLSQIAKLKASIEAIEGDIAQKQAEIANIDDNFSAMNDTLSSLLKAIDDLVQKDPSRCFEKDVEQIQKYLTTLFIAMRQQLVVDRFESMIEGDKQGNLSDHDLEQIAASMVQAEADEETTLDNLFEELSNDLIDEHKRFDDAKADKARYNAIEKFFNWKGAATKAHRDEDKMKSSSQMISIIQTVIGNLSPALALLMPEFAQLSLMLQEIERKIEKIVNTKGLSPKAMQGEILSLMMFLLGFFNLLNQTAQNQAAKNQKRTAEANLDASKINLMHTEMNQKIQEEELRNARILKIVMFVAQMILGAVMTLLAPGAGAALLSATLTVLGATGGPQGKSALDKLTDALAKKIGHPGAESLVAIFEVATTVGGGAAIDKVTEMALQKVAQSAIEGAEAGVAALVKQVAELAVAAVGKEGDPAALAAATQAAQSAGSQAAKIAAHTSAEQFAKQSIADQIKLLGKQTYEEELKRIVTEAANAAAKQAVKNSLSLAEVSARWGEASAQDGISSLAKKEAIEAMSKVLTDDKKDIAKIVEYNAMKTAAMRGLATGIYGIASNNLILDAAMAIAKKEGVESDSKLYEELKMAIGLIQGILAAIVQGVASTTATSFKSSLSGVPQIALYAQLAPQGIQSIAQMSLYPVEAGQAESEKGMTLGRAISDILQSYSEKAIKDAEATQERSLGLIRQETQANHQLAEHMFDGTYAAVSVINEAV